MATTANININLDAKQANGSIKDLSNSIEASNKSSESLRAQLKKMTLELQGLEVGTARFNELSRAAGELRDQIGDTNKIIQASGGTALETLGKGLAGATNIGIQGFQGVASAIALVTGNEKQLQELFFKIQAFKGVVDSIQFFGGLPDIVKEISSSFRAFSTTIGLTTSAINAQTIATVGLSIAQKALLGAGLIAGLAAITYSIYNLTSAEEESAEAAKERNRIIDIQAEKNKKLAESTKENSDSIAKESSGYVLLINQLKATNAGSKERSDLIKQINTEYGSTLKNISNERDFQNQLNVAVNDYINFQKQRLLLSKYDENVNKLLSEQVTLESKIAKLKDPMNLDDWRKRTTSGQQAINEEIKKGEERLVEITFRLADYGKQSLKISNDIKGKYVPAKQEQNKVDKEGSDELERQIKLRDELTKLQLEEKKLEVEREDLRKTKSDPKAQVEKDFEIVKETALKTARDKILADYGNYIDEYNIKQQIYINRIAQTNKNEADELSKQLESRRLFQLKMTKRIEESGEGVFSATSNIYTLESMILSGKLDKLKDTNSEEYKLTKKHYDDLIILSHIYHNQALSKRAADASNKESYQTEYFAAVKQAEILLNLQKDSIDKRRKLTADEIKDLSLLYQADATKRELLELEFNNRKINNQLAVLESEYALNRQLLVNKGANNDELLKLDKEYLETSLDLMEKLYTPEEIIKKKLEISQKAVADFTNSYNDSLATLGSALTTAISGDLNNVASSFKAFSDALISEGGVFSEIGKKWDSLDFKGRVSAITEGVQQAASVALEAISAMYQKQAEDEAAATEERYRQEDRALEESLENRSISQEEYDATIKRNDYKRQTEERQARRQSFEQQKSLALTNAAIGIAASIIQSLATLPPPASYITAGISAAMGAVELAVIEKQKFRAARGGIVPGSGSGAVDSVNALLAPGEMVINSRSASMFPSLLSNINVAGGGAQLAPSIPQPLTPSVFNNSTQVRAYVVESDITTSQKRVSRFERSGQF